ncbi:MAG: ChrR family anti-sigma-E factor [Porticoccaceae bacterium]|nr:ChrR family anti-sigma-E factor [Porticoccaceae bacterium]
MSTLKHHPDTAMLVDFSAGNLSTAASICVSAHLHFCDRCKEELLRLDQVGSQLMSESEPVDVEEQLFDKVMAEIDALPDSEAVAVPKVIDNYPLSVSKLIDYTRPGLKWRKMSGSVDVAKFKTGQSDFEVALHRIRAGGKTPHHGHGGQEFTVVLKGSFSDENAVYTEGDFLLREAGDEHQPTGAQNGECICLSALAAPIKLSNPLGFLMKPWLRINPM